MFGQADCPVCRGAGMGRCWWPVVNRTNLAQPPEWVAGLARCECSGEMPEDLVGVQALIRAWARVGQMGHWEWIHTQPEHRRASLIRGWHEMAARWAALIEDVGVEKFS